MPDPSEPILALDAVARTYRVGTVEVPALRGVTLGVPRGQRVAVLGKSGSGKSTLLHLLAGLDRPTAGRVTVAGRDVGAMTPDELADYRLRTVGVVFQSFHLVATRSALDNVMMPLVFAGLGRRERRRKAEASLAEVGLGTRLSHRPTQLSGGECQRVALARALVNDPELLLCDEPTGNLDTATAADVMALILGKGGEGRTLVLVTHDRELASRSSQRILTLADGIMVSDHSP